MSHFNPKSSHYNSKQQASNDQPIYLTTPGDVNPKSL